MIGTIHSAHAELFNTMFMTKNFIDNETYDASMIEALKNSLFCATEKEPFQVVKENKDKYKMFVFVRKTSVTSYEQKEAEWSFPESGDTWEDTAYDLPTVDDMKKAADEENIEAFHKWKCPFEKKMEEHGYKNLSNFSSTYLRDHDPKVLAYLGGWEDVNGNRIATLLIDMPALRAYKVLYQTNVHLEETDIAPKCII